MLPRYKATLYTAGNATSLTSLLHKTKQTEHSLYTVSADSCFIITALMVYSGKACKLKLCVIIQLTFLCEHLRRFWKTLTNASRQSIGPSGSGWSVVIQRCTKLPYSLIHDFDVWGSEKPSWRAGIGNPRGRDCLIETHSVIPAQGGGSQPGLQIWTDNTALQDPGVWKHFFKELNSSDKHRLY